MTGQAVGTSKGKNSELIELLAAGKTRQQLCEYFKLSDHSLRAWLSRLHNNPAYRDAIHPYIWSSGKPKPSGATAAQYRKQVKALLAIEVEAEELRELASNLKRADEGDTNSQVAIAQLFLEGKTLRQDNNRAATYFHKAALGGNAHAQLMTGRAYQQGILGPADVAQANEWYEKAVASGSRIAAGELAWNTYFGHGVARDTARGRELAQLAANDALDVRGRHVLAHDLLLTARISPQEVSGEEKGYAIRLLKTAASKGFGPAQLELGRVYRKGEFCTVNHDEATRWFEEAARGGSLDAMKELVEVQFYRDKAQAKQWAERILRVLRKRALANEVEAQFEFADWLDGREVTDLLGGTAYPEAISWFLKAAEKGHVKAMIRLAIAYESSSPMAKSMLPTQYTAVHWYRMAAEHGSTFAKVKLGMLYRSGKKVEKDTGESLKWYTAAAEAGDKFSCLRVGLFFIESGDWENALSWFAKAGRDGSYLAGLVLEQRGMLEEALQMFECAVASEFRPVGACVAAGLLYKAKGDLTKALERFSSAASGERGAMIVIKGQAEAGLYNSRHNVGTALFELAAMELASCSNRQLAISRLWHSGDQRGLEKFVEHNVGIADICDALGTRADSSFGFSEETICSVTVSRWMPEVNIRVAVEALKHNPSLFEISAHGKTHVVAFPRVPELQDVGINLASEPSCRWYQLTFDDVRAKTPVGAVEEVIRQLDTGAPRGPYCTRNAGGDECVGDISDDFISSAAMN